MSHEGMRKVYKVSFSIDVELESSDEHLVLEDEIMAEMKDYAFEAIAAGETGKKRYFIVIGPTGMDGVEYFLSTVNNAIMTTEVFLRPEDFLRPETGAIYLT